MSQTLPRSAKSPNALSSAGGMYHFIAVCALFAGVVWVYWPTLARLAEMWSNDPKYSHGYLVPMFAGFLLWHRLRRNDAGKWQASGWGLVLIAAALGIRAAGVAFFFPTLEAYALLPLVAGCVLAVGGGDALRVGWPAVAFLVLMLPLPYRLESALAAPLQSIATSATVYFMQTLGLPAYAEGNIIRWRDGQVNVAEACNGLSMLMMFVAMSAAVVLLADRRAMDNGIILASAAPIAIVCNVIRIVATSIVYVSVGQTLGELVPFFNHVALPGGQVLGAVDVHDFNGWLMMPLALGLLWLELRILDWVLVEPAATRVKNQRRNFRATVGKLVSATSPAANEVGSPQE